LIFFKTLKEYINHIPINSQLTNILIELRIAPCTMPINENIISVIATALSLATA
jgi:hypothetical protein